MLVKGDRIVPPRMAPMLTSGQKPAPSWGRNIASSPPSAPPIISNGASTPPEVPEPSDTAQINHFTKSTPRITLVVTAPWSSAPILLIALAVWLAATAGLRPLLLPDEGRYAWVAFGMLHGDALVPKLDGLPFFHKPPL